jgi:hypothetical protein
MWRLRTKINPFENETIIQRPVEPVDVEGELGEQIQ